MAFVQFSTQDEQWVHDPTFEHSEMDLSIGPSTNIMSAASLPFKGREPPTPQEWENIRPLFTQLYCVENKKLETVMRVLESEHGFRANKRMYNKRINDWNVHKNYKKSEKAAMVQAFKVDKASTNAVLRRGSTVARDLTSTGLTFKGRTVKVDRLVRYLKETQGANSDPRPVFGGVPEPARLITECGESRDVETLYLCVSQHLGNYMASKGTLQSPISGKVSLGVAIADDERAPGILLKEPEDFKWKLDAAITLQRHSRISTAFRILDEAMNDVSYLCLRQHPNLISRFFLLDQYTKQANPEFVQSVWGFVTNMAETVLGSSHPIVVACTIVQNLIIDNWKMSVWRTVNDILSRALGPDDLHVVKAHDWHFSTLVTIGESEQALQDLDRRFAGNDIWKVAHSRRQCQVLSKLQRYDEAEVKIRSDIKILRQFRDHILASGNKRILRRLTYENGSLAVVLEGQGKYLAAGEQWQEGVNFSRRALGLLDSATCVMLSSFECFLQRNGQSKEAAALRSRYPHVFQ